MRKTDRSPRPDRQVPVEPTPGPHQEHVFELEDVPNPTQVSAVTSLQPGLELGLTPHGGRVSATYMNAVVGYLPPAADAVVRPHGRMLTALARVREVRPEAGGSGALRVWVAVSV